MWLLLTFTFIIHNVICAPDFPIFPFKIQKQINQHFIRHLETTVDQIFTWKHNATVNVCLKIFKTIWNYTYKNQNYECKSFCQTERIPANSAKALPVHVIINDEICSLNVSSFKCLCEALGRLHDTSVQVPIDDNTEFYFVPVDTTKYFVLQAKSKNFLNVKTYMEMRNGTRSPQDNLTL